MPGIREGWIGLLKFVPALVASMAMLWCVYLFLSWAVL